MKFLTALYTGNVDEQGYEWPVIPGEIVQADDCNPDDILGGGLYGLVDGAGALDHIEHASASLWIAFESVDDEGRPSDADAVLIGGRGLGKCRRAVVRAAGTCEEVARWLVDAGCTDVHWATVTAEAYRTAAVGDHGVARASLSGAAIAGDYGEAVAGNEGIARAHERGKAKAGIEGVAVAGRDGKAETSVFGVSVTYAGGESTTKDQGYAITGYGGIAKTGKAGVAAAGPSGRVAGGLGSVLLLRDSLLAWVVAVVGEEGIEPDTPYCLNDAGKFVKVKAAR